jgi:hypothetical protein
MAYVFMKPGYHAHLLRWAAAMPVDVELLNNPWESSSEALMPRLFLIFCWVFKGETNSSLEFIFKIT